MGSSEVRRINDKIVESQLDKTAQAESQDKNPTAHTSFPSRLHELRKYHLRTTNLHLEPRTDKAFTPELDRLSARDCSSEASALPNVRDKGKRPLSPEEERQLKKWLKSIPIGEDGKRVPRAFVLSDKSRPDRLILVGGCDPCCEAICGIIVGVPLCALFSLWCYEHWSNSRRRENCMRSMQSMCDTTGRGCQGFSAWGQQLCASGSDYTRENCIPSMRSMRNAMGSRIHDFCEWRRQHTAGCSDNVRENCVQSMQSIRDTVDRFCLPGPQPEQPMQPVLPEQPMQPVLPEQPMQRVLPEQPMQPSPIERHTPFLRPSPMERPTPYVLPSPTERPMPPVLPSTIERLVPPLPEPSVSVSPMPLSLEELQKMIESTQEEYQRIQNPLEVEARRGQEQRIQRLQEILQTNNEAEAILVPRYLLSRVLQDEQRLQRETQVSERQEQRTQQLEEILQANNGAEAIQVSTDFLEEIMQDEQMLWGVWENNKKQIEMKMEELNKKLKEQQAPSSQDAKSNPCR